MCVVDVKLWAAPSGGAMRLAEAIVTPVQSVKRSKIVYVHASASHV